MATPATLTIVEQEPSIRDLVQFMALKDLEGAITKMFRKAQIKIERTDGKTWSRFSFRIKGEILIITCEILEDSVIRQFYAEYASSKTYVDVQKEEPDSDVDDEDELNEDRPATTKYRSIVSLVKEACDDLIKDKVCADLYNKIKQVISLVIGTYKAAIKSLDAKTYSEEAILSATDKFRNSGKVVDIVEDVPLLFQVARALTFTSFQVALDHSPEFELTNRKIRPTGLIGVAYASLFFKSDCSKMVVDTFPKESHRQILANLKSIVGGILRKVLKNKIIVYCRANTRKIAEDKAYAKYKIEHDRRLVQQKVASELEEAKKMVEKENKMLELENKRLEKELEKLKEEVAMAKINHAEACKDKQKLENIIATLNEELATLDMSTLEGKKRGIHLKKMIEGLKVDVLEVDYEIKEENGAIKKAEEAQKAIELRRSKRRQQKRKVEE